MTTSLLEDYNVHVQERAEEGIPPLPLSYQLTSAVCTALREGTIKDKGLDLLQLLSQRIDPGVTDAGKLKAELLGDVAKGELRIFDLSQSDAIKLLGSMQGGYNVEQLIPLLELAEDQSKAAVSALSNTLLISEPDFKKVDAMRSNGNAAAGQVVTNWSDATWFTSRPEIPGEIELVVYRIEGEINTDDFSPAQHAKTRDDIPRHALSFLERRKPEAFKELNDLVAKGVMVVLVADVMWTGSSRKSAYNSLAWILGDAIPFVPNKRGGGIVIGGDIAPIGRDTIADGGGLAIVCDVSKLEHLQKIRVCPHDGKILNEAGDNTLAEFEIEPFLLDSARAGGRLNLVIGKKLTSWAREALSLESSTVFAPLPSPEPSNAGFTLGEKTIGKACGLDGVRAGQYCEPAVGSVASQDTTGPMTRDELAALACLSFEAPLVLQSFCHTAATPTDDDLSMHKSLSAFMADRGGVALRKGDGVIHTWINRCLLPDQVGTGGDSHTRFPMGVSFPGGSGLVAFAAAKGLMPLTMPESVLVKFTGTLQPGITIRDLVNAIPYVAIQTGRLTVEKKGKFNVFSGRLIEIDVRDLLVDGKAITLEQSFEFADATAERSSAACAMINNLEEVVKYVSSNRALLANMLKSGYGHAPTIQSRIDEMDGWLADPELLVPDDNCEYYDTVEVNLDEIKEPLLCCPNDPDDVKPLSEVAGAEIDEVFTGSCMTHRGHFETLSNVVENSGNVETVLWMAPPSRMDRASLEKTGSCDILRTVGANIEESGCSLCMGNQKRTKPGATVVSTSTRNFKDRMGDGAFVYLASSEVAAVTATLGRIPNMDQYMEVMKQIDHSPVHNPLQFDKDGVPEMEQVAS